MSKMNQEKGHGIEREQSASPDTGRTRVRKQKVLLGHATAIPIQNQNPTEKAKPQSTHKSHQ